MKHRQYLQAVAALAAAVAFAGCAYQPSGNGTATSGYRANGPDSSPDADFNTAPTGLKYLIRSKGNHRRASPDDMVTLRFQGWIRQPDGSRQPIEGQQAKLTRQYRLDEMIPGWRQGLALVGEGGRIELIVPPNLGYGAHGVWPYIPPNATLQFDIELVSIGR